MQQLALKLVCVITIKTTMWTIVALLLVLIGQGLGQLPTEQFPPKVDLGILLDTSIGDKEFELAKKFINQQLKYISISLSTTRVSLVTVHSSAVTEFGYKRYTNRECIVETLRRLRYNEADPVDPKGIVDGLELLKKARRHDASHHIFVILSLKTFLALNYVKIRLEDTYTSETRTFFIILNKIINRQGLSGNMNLLKKNGAQFKVFELTSEYQIYPLISKLGLMTDDYTKCEGNGKQLDECERHCDCVNGTLSNCYRIRKEFTDMTRKERHRYLSAYLTLSTKQPYKYKYEKIIYIHYKYFCMGIHRNYIFFPWHRWYLLMMESLLQEIDCRITLPYWDWNFYGDDPWNATHVWSSTDDGLGGNGTASKGFCVQSGLFKEGAWRTPFYNDAIDEILSSIDQLDTDVDSVQPDMSSCLRRSLHDHLPNRINLLNALKLSADEFSDFEIHIRHNYHDHFHNSIGGTMSTHYAASAPEFFLHHAFLDKIWFMWQKKSIEHRDANFKSKTSKMIGCPYRPLELLDSHNLPGCLKVTYSKFPHHKADRVKRQNEDDDEIDAMDKTPIKYWKGILELADSNRFPNCERSNKEKQRAKYLNQLFNNPHFIGIPHTKDVIHRKKSP